MASKGFAEATGTVISVLAGLGGRKPTIPDAPHVETGAAAIAAGKANLGAIPDLEKIASQVDEFNIDELFKNLEKFSPGITENIRKIPSIIASQLKGEVPEDVLTQIRRGVGAKAYQLGMSPEQRANMTAESIGQTSYSIQQQGVQSASRWMAQVEGSIPRFDFSRMFITPAQEIATEQWNEANRFNVELMRNKLAAAPSAMDQALTGALEGFGSILDSVGSMSLGGIMGGGGGGPSGGGDPGLARDWSNYYMGGQGEMPGMGPSAMSHAGSLTY